MPINHRPPPLALSHAPSGHNIRVHHTEVMDVATQNRKHAVKRFDSNQSYRDAFNAVLSLAAILMLVYGLTSLGAKSKQTRWRWFAIDLMTQIISIQLASDLIPHGIAVKGRDQMDAAVGMLLVAVLALTLIGDMTGLSTASRLWYLVDGASLALFLAVLLKYLVELVA
jgi:hypothetical protein